MSPPSSYGWSFRGASRHLLWKRSRSLPSIMNITFATSGRRSNLLSRLSPGLRNSSLLLLTATDLPGAWNGCRGNWHGRQARSTSL